MGGEIAGEIVIVHCIATFPGGWRVGEIEPGESAGRDDLEFNRAL